MHCSIIRKAKSVCFALNFLNEPYISLSIIDPRIIRVHPYEYSFEEHEVSQTNDILTFIVPELTS